MWLHIHAGIKVKPRLVKGATGSKAYIIGRLALLLWSISTRWYMQPIKIVALVYEQ